MTVATLDVLLNHCVGARDPKIFGHFIEHFHRQIYGGVFDPRSPLANANGFRSDVIGALRRIRCPVVRWPGGCFASAYPWKKGVGKTRIPYYDKAWRVEEPNTFGTDEFIEFCRQVGAEFYVCANAGTGGPEEMSDWVEYCNLEVGEWAARRRESGRPEPHKVRYWSIGNENYGGWEMGAKTADEWARYVRESAKMMKRADPSIELAAPTVADIDWNAKLLHQAGDLLDWVSIHGYYGSLDSSYGEIIARSGEPERLISKTESILDSLGCSGKIRIAFDEWNARGWHHPGFGGFGAADRADMDRNDDNSIYTMADALFSARFLNACLRHCGTVGMANFSPVVNTVGAVFTHEQGIVLRPSYHVFDLYANHTHAEVLRCFVTSPSFAIGSGQGSQAAVPHLEAVATRDPETDALSIVLVNLHEAEPVSCRVRLLNGAGGRKIEHLTLTGDDPDAFNDVDSPDRVGIQAGEMEGVDWDSFEYECPAHSVVVLKSHAARRLSR
jgi:alpha-N-arabinofuranosidase